MSVNASPFGPCPQFELASGAPAVGNKLFFYVAGSSTKQNTYTNSTGATPNANPIVLDSLGQTPNEVWFTAGQSYKVVYAPANDTDPPTSPIRTWDNLFGINDTSITIDQWVASGLTPTYISATQFTLVGDQTTAFHVGRRLKTTNSGGTIYSTISVSAYTSVTTITVVNDSGTLDAGLSAVSYGLLSVTNNAEPRGVFALLAGSASQAFTASDFTVSGGGPGYNFTENDVGADLKKWAIYVNAEKLRFSTFLDAGALLLETLSIDRAGNLTVAGEISGTTGTFSGVLNGQAGIKNNGVLVISQTAPTIASGFGTSPSIASSNGSFTFRVNVGTGGTASSGTITMPAAPNGWNCLVQAKGSQNDQRTYVSTTTTTSIILVNIRVSTGSTLAWDSSTEVMCICVPY